MKGVQMHWQALHDSIGSEGASITWYQMSVRGTLIFAIGLLFVRIAGKRLFGKWGALDTVVAVIIGSNLSRAMTGSAPFFPTICVTAVLLFLHELLVYAAVYVRPLSALIKGQPVQLVRAGRRDDLMMRRHGIGSGDLEESLRCHGTQDVAQVAAAFLERNGTISVVFDSKR
jgi:uncharacterized membrane protein YcaP (DUF421 family)